MPSGAVPGGRTTAVGSTTARLRVVSTCAFRLGIGKEHPGSPDAPAPFLSRWSITIFLACAILPQMNRQPMCILGVKSPFTQYISTYT